jgi:hypothetical protein
MKLSYLAVLFIVVVACCNACRTEKAEKQNVVSQIQVPTIIGEWQDIFNPNDTRANPDSNWYTNDHCFIKGPNGKWHAYGIIGETPIDCWEKENKLFHITADKFDQKTWEDHDYALTTKPGVEKVLWAPHVYEENGTYHMFYNIGNLQKHAPHYSSWGQLCRADSKNMFDWERHSLNPLFSDPGHARDSYIMKVNGIYYYYYTRIFNEVDQRSVVAMRTSPDLKHWSGPKLVHVQAKEGHSGSDAESPFVVK